MVKVAVQTNTSLLVCDLCSVFAWGTVSPTELPALASETVSLVVQQNSSDHVLNCFSKVLVSTPLRCLLGTSVVCFLLEPPATFHTFLAICCTTCEQLGYAVGED